MAIVRLNKDHIYYEFDPTNPENHLGTGGMGVVFRGRRIEIDSGRVDSVAIKVLFKDLPVESIARARREASIQIEHENVIRMYGCVDVVDVNKNVTCHVISEYLDGETLDKRSNNGEILAETEAIKIVKCVLSGLYMIHDKGYIHRDIDPSNVMMCRNGKIKLIDFGIVKNTAESAGIQEGNETLKKGTQVGKFIGKIFYASPEQAQGLHNETDKRSDVYSVGVLLYQLITGRVPFNGNTAYEIIKQHIESPIVFESPINANLRHIIEKAAAKKKEDRYQTVSEFIVDLEKYESGLSIPATKIKKSSKQQSSKTWLFVTITLLLVLLAGGGVVVYNLHLSQIKAIQMAQDLVVCGQYDKALKQYEDAIKFYAPQSTIDELNLLREAKETIARYNNFSLSDSLLLRDLTIIAERGFKDGYYYSAELCINGILTIQDQTLAIEYLMNGEQRQNILSTYRLGEAYFNGEMTPVNKEQANVCFNNVLSVIEQYDIDELSSELQYILGKIYRYGYSVEKDDNIAVERFEKAITTNHTGAYYELYLLKKVDNEAIANKYLNEAAKRGYTKAEYDLALLQIAKKQYIEAIELLKKVSVKKYAEANEQLALAYYQIAWLKSNIQSEYVKYMGLAIEATKDNSKKTKWGNELSYNTKPRYIESPKPEPEPALEPELKLEPELEGTAVGVGLGLN